MMVNAATYSDIWENCLCLIREKTSDDEFAKWFKPIVPIGFDGTTLRLRVPNEDYVYHIEKNYIASLRKIIYAQFGDRTCLRYSIPTEKSESIRPAYSASQTDTTPISKYVESTDTTKIKNPFIIPGIKKLVIDPQLNPSYNFGTFVQGNCNRLLCSVGIEVALNPGITPYNPLYIYGESGLGKTHLAQAIGAEIRQRHPELQVLYVSMNKFQSQYTTAMLNHEPNDFINFYQMMDVLIIDDIQELSGNKGSTQSAFFNIFNHLHLSGKQLILTSDKKPVELSDINDRLLTRFKWGFASELTRPDYETRVKIIKTKAARFKAEVPDEVVDYLAENLDANIREIEGVLSSLMANSEFMKRRITPQLAKEILKVYVKITQKEITIDQIRNIVCDALAVDKQTLDSPKRTREVAQARQIAMYLCKQHTKAPLTAIGAAIGGKNHATVLHACKQVANLIDTDKQFAQLIEDLEQRVMAK